MALSLRICFFLFVFIAALSESNAFAKALSDLEVFSRSIRELQKTYSDPDQKTKYRKALETYSTPAAPVTRNFDRIFSELHKLWAKIDGLDKRLVAVQQPLMFQYPTPEKTVFTFNRVSQALHAVWLLTNLRESTLEFCSERDTLLIDRWTPILKDTTVFAVEKNGNYFGTTITLVPIKRGSVTYLLVVPSGKYDQIPAPLLEAFLRDYRKKEPSLLRFALLSKLITQHHRKYQIDRIDDQGKKVAVLGPASGFQLADPMAKKIVAISPVKCTPGSGDAAEVPLSGTGAGSVAGSDYTNGPSNTTINFNADPELNANSALSANPTVNVGPDSRTGSGGADQVRTYQGNGPTTINNNTINNSVPTPQNTGGRDSAQSNTGTTGRAQSFSPGSASSNLPPGWAFPPGGNGSVGGGVAAGGKPSGSNADGGGGLAGMPGPASNGIDRSRLSPSDRDILDNIGRAERALREGRPVPPEVLGNIFSGPERAVNPDVRREAEEARFKSYFEGGLSGYNELRKNPEIKKHFNPDKLARQLQNELCHHCPDCEYCKHEKRRLEASK